MKAILYILVTTTIATSCLDVSNVVTSLPPSSIDSTLSVGDYTFRINVDSTAISILIE